MPNKLSLCMITKNEEQFIAKCIDSVKQIVDEIIVVDTGSTDNTVKIAEERGAKIHHFSWIDDFSAARNESLKHATGDWILVLDADETIAKEDLNKIRKLIENDDKQEKPTWGFYLIQRNYLLGKGEIPKDEKLCSSQNDTYNESKQFFGWMPNDLVRLFRNKKEIKYQYVIHEVVEQSILDNKGVIRQSGIPIHHFQTLKGTSEKKNDKYIRMGLDQIKRTPDNPKPYFEIGMTYIIKNDLDKAIEYLEKAKVRNPKYEYVCFELGQLYMKQNKIQEAINAFEQSIEFNNDIRAYTNLSSILINANKIAQAINLLENAKTQFTIEEYPTLEPKIKKIHTNLSVAYIRANRLDEAMAILEESLKKFKDKKNLLINLVSLCFMRGGEELAKEKVRTLLDKKLINRELCKDAGEFFEQSGHSKIKKLLRDTCQI